MHIDCDIDENNGDDLDLSRAQSNIKYDVQVSVTAMMDSTKMI